MSLNLWIAVLVVLVPTLALLAIAVAVRICLLVVGHEPSANWRSLHPVRSAPAPDRRRTGTAH